MRKQLLTYLFLINCLVVMGQVSEIAIAPTDNFNSGGANLHHYGVGFYQYGDGYNLYGSGYFGVNLFTEGQNRLRIARNGFVGIGTTTPAAKLHVNGNLKIGTETDGSIMYLNGKPNVSWGYVFDNSQQNALTIKSQHGESSPFSIDPFGNVGIGTSAPLAKLHVQNGDNSYGAILAQADECSFQLYTKTITTQPCDVASFRIGLKYGTDENNGFITFYRGDASGNGFLGFATNGQERIRISKDGNVGIGTSTPSHKLEVNGTIRAKEIKVDAENWPDFVFDDGYSIKSLGEVEAYIQTNKHLPDVPSAQQMEASGVDLAQMNKLLLQKVEELTLYIIRQQKDIDELTRKVENQIK